MKKKTIFFDEKKKLDKKYKISLLKALLNKIYNYDYGVIEIKANDILCFFKFCCEYKIEIKNIEPLEIKKVQDWQKSELNKNYFVSDKDIDNLGMKIKKSKFLYLLIEIFANCDDTYLFKLLNSKYGNDFSRGTLDLLIDEKIKFKNFSFKDEKEFINFQKNLLSISDKKEEVNYIIRLSKSLYNNLIFINENFATISKILEDNAKVLRWKSTNYQLSLESPSETDDIDKIFIALSDIIKLLKDHNKAKRH